MILILVHVADFQLCMHKVLQISTIQAAAIVHHYCQPVLRFLSAPSVFQNQSIEVQEAVDASLCGLTSFPPKMSQHKTSKEILVLQGTGQDYEFRHPGELMLLWAPCA